MLLKGWEKGQDCDPQNVLTKEGKQYCLSYLLGSQPDFLTEKSDMEHLCFEISKEESRASVLYTPKFYCELPGEGVEYS